MAAVLEGAAAHGLKVDAMEWCVLLPQKRLQPFRPGSIPWLPFLTFFLFSPLLTPTSPRSASATNGRPKPWMSTRVAEVLDAYPLYSCVKVDDTLPGIEEGVNAGMWTVGVSRSGNEFGLDATEEAALLASNPGEHKARLERAKARFVSAGANFVIDSVADLLPIVERINALVKAGKTPFSTS